MTDDRLHDYLTGRAAGIDLAPGDPAGIVRRATRRRHRRRAGLVGSVATVAVVATSLAVVDRSGEGEPLEAASPGVVVETPLEWTMVDPGTTLGFTRATAQAEDGTTYALSTAPGARSDDPATDRSPQTLYRTADGTDWEVVELPADVWASSVAAGTDRVYALGTAPGAGGGKDVVLATSTGRAGFETVRLDLGPELEDLLARFPGELDVRPPAVAAGPDGPVAALRIRTETSELAEALVLDRHGRHLPWRVDADGVHVMEEPTCIAPDEGDEGDEAWIADEGEGVAEAPDPVLPEPLPGAGGPESAVVDGVIAEEGVGVDPAGVCMAHTDLAPGTTVLASYPWDEVGLDPELVPFVEGRLVVLAPGADGQLTPVAVDLPGEVVDPVLLAVEGGFRLVAGTSDEVGRSAYRVLRSTDGLTWEADPAGEHAGWVTASGVLDGRLALVGVDLEAGGAVLRLEQDGGWSSVDLGAALPEGARYYVYEAAVGPLGAAAVAWVHEDGEDGPATPLLVHSDGTSVSVVDLPGLAGPGAEGYGGVTVTADAVVVRVLGPQTEHDERETVGLLVGTPPG